MVAEIVHEILDRPIRPSGLEVIGCGTVLPNRVPEGLEHVGAHARLGKPAGDVAAENVSAPPLSEVRVSGKVDENLA